LSELLPELRLELRCQVLSQYLPHFAEPQQANNDGIAIGKPVDKTVAAVTKACG
jgi:hypothetical protein